MKIQTSAIALSSNQSLIRNETKEESLKYWTDNQRPDARLGNLGNEKLSVTIMDILEISPEAQKQAAANNEINKADGNQIVELTISDEDKLKIHLLEKMLEKLTGKKIKFNFIDKIKIQNNQMNIRANTGSVPQRQGWGLEYDYHESYYEKENMSFDAKGLIKTSDGRTIDFSLQLNMSREFASQTNLRIRGGDAAIDPLVINLNGMEPKLTQAKYTFDLDSDGVAEKVSFVSPGNGFLALDLNSDNVINNGKELFGPGTGGGFGELGAYDNDNNGWIDENDPIYDKLRIWIKDENGKDQLLALGQKGVGAIYVGNIDSPFSIKNSNNDLLGNIRSSGVYIKENGTAGTIHQIDLAV